MKLLISFLIIITAIGLQLYYNNISSTIVNRAFSKIIKPTSLSKITSKLQKTMSQPTSDFKGLPVVPQNDPSLSKDLATSVARGISKSFEALEQSEGAGARVRRSIGSAKLRNFTPFLMLDHFNVPVGAGFPDHPHRSQETITYILNGSADHEDFAGNKGTIGPGDLQFMTAGRGIMHAEMPNASPDGSPNVGLQMWVDLPKHLKMCEPRYRDLRAGEIPIDTSDNDKVNIKVISGKTASGTESLQELSYTPVWLLDVTIKPGGKLVQPLPANWNSFAYLLSGSATFGEGQQKRVIDQYHIAVFEQKGDKVVAEVDEDATEDARFIIASGMPLDQPIVQYGPFVVTSTEEVYQALRDFQTYSNGFERGKGWESEIGKRMA